MTHWHYISSVNTCFYWHWSICLVSWLSLICVLLQRTGLYPIFILRFTQKYWQNKSYTFNWALAFTWMLLQENWKMCQYKHFLTPGFSMHLIKKRQPARIRVSTKSPWEARRSWLGAGVSGSVVDAFTFQFSHNAWWETSSHRHCIAAFAKPIWNECVILTH